MSLRHVSASGAKSSISVQNPRSINFEEITTPADMKPRDIVAALDKYIIGQGEAKRSVAVALRNRCEPLFHNLSSRMGKQISEK